MTLKVVGAVAPLSKYWHRKAIFRLTTGKERMAQLSVASACTLREYVLGSAVLRARVKVGCVVGLQLKTGL